jgi:hypothetical protein
MASGAFSEITWYRSGRLLVKEVRGRWNPLTLDTHGGSGGGGNYSSLTQHENKKEKEGQKRETRRSATNIKPEGA